MRRLPDHRLKELSPALFGALSAAAMKSSCREIKPCHIDGILSVEKRLGEDRAIKYIGYRLTGENTYSEVYGEADPAKELNEIRERMERIEKKLDLLISANISKELLDSLKKEMV